MENGAGSREPDWCSSVSMMGTEGAEVEDEIESGAEQQGGGRTAGLSRQSRFSSGWRQNRTAETENQMSYSEQTARTRCKHDKNYLNTGSSTKWQQSQ